MMRSQARKLSNKSFEHIQTQRIKKTCKEFFHINLDNLWPPTMETQNSNYFMLTGLFPSRNVQMGPLPFSLLYSSAVFLSHFLVSKGQIRATCSFYSKLFQCFRTLSNYLCMASLIKNTNLLFWACQILIHWQTYALSPLMLNRLFLYLCNSLLGSLIFSELLSCLSCYSLSPILTKLAEKVLIRPETNIYCYYTVNTPTKCLVN